MEKTLWRNSYLQTHWKNSTHFEGTLIGGTQLTLEELTSLKSLEELNSL